MSTRALGYFAWGRKVWVTLKWKLLHESEILLCVRNRLTAGQSFLMFPSRVSCHEIKAPTVCSELSIPYTFLLRFLSFR